MDRREYLTGAIPVLSAALAGCSGTSEPGETRANCADGWSPRIEAEEPTLAPGEGTTVHITATDVSGVTLRERGPSLTSFGLEFNNASLSPGPAYGSEGYPPGDAWEECTTVEIAIPLTALQMPHPVNIPTA